MPTSIYDPAIQNLFDQVRSGPPTLFPSPEDWRDCPIYFLMVDRFNNPNSSPQTPPFDGECSAFQGGTFNGIRAQLDYLKELGVGALWLSPVLKNCAYDPHTYHGYGIQNFLEVEPRFGSSPGAAAGELRALVDQAHARGLYVILDIVLHHSGDVFAYVGAGDDAPWQDQRLPIQWRDALGQPNPAWADAPASPPPDAALFPDELRQNQLFTCQGDAFSAGFHPAGDFRSLRGIATEFTDTNGLKVSYNILIRAFQYAIARFDVDGFRIDTLKFVTPEFERIFGNAMREFALSVGKKNFFTFGEVYDNENTIAQFIGRNTSATGDVVGVDAALDFPLFYLLPGTAKGLPGYSAAGLAGVFENRKQVEQSILTSHGEAGQYFVTFLDNHDQPQRFGYTGPTQFVDQIVLGLACLYTLQGIPCVYYGTEQGLSGHKDAARSDDSMVREALWGKPLAFNPNHPIYLALQALGRVRSGEPVLRYGRMYFRPVSGDGVNFGISTDASGVVAFSRILNDQEAVVVANTNLASGFQGQVIVDHTLNPSGSLFGVLFTNKGAAGTPPGPVLNKPQGSVTIYDLQGGRASGPASVIPVRLGPLEVQILKSS
jgi:glycosidase